MVAMSERVMNPISTPELERRWAAVRAKMAERGIDVLYTHGANEWSAGYIKWLIDRVPGNGTILSVVFPREADMIVLGPGPFGGNRELPPGGDGVLRGVARMMTAPHFLGATYSERYLREATEAALAGFEGATIGLVCPAQMSYTLVDQLKSRFTRARFVDATDLLDETMVIKSAEEIALVRSSAELQDRAFRAVLEGVRPGMRDNEVTAIAEHFTRLEGSETGLISGASGPIGKGAHMAFRHMQARVFREGDQFTLLIETAGPGGAFCELGRTFCLGKATQQMKDEMALAIEAQELTVSMLRPGADCAEIWEAHNAFLRAHGRAEEKRLYAHGQGYFLVERPLIRFDEPMRISADMNVAVHPMFMHEGNFNWVCDNFLVGEQATERLHRTEQKIFEID